MKPVYKINLYMLPQNRFVWNHKNQICATTPVFMWQYDFCNWFCNTV